MTIIQQFLVILLQKSEKSLQNCAEVCKCAIARRTPKIVPHTRFKKDRIAPPKMYIDIECCVRTLFLSKCLSRLQKRTEAHCF